MLAPPATAHDAATELATAAKALLTTLDENQQSAAMFPFTDAERLNWHFVPRERKGLPMKELVTEQRMMVHALLANGLSHTGYTKAAGIMSLEGVLGRIENRPDRRDPDNYYLSIFGTPGVEPWGWRFEGHHLALNFTIAGGNVTVTSPQFFGANPAEVREGPRAGWRVLAAEEDLGREIVTSLDAAQRRKAIIMAEAPRDVINMPGRQDSKPEGIAWADLNATQREKLLQLIREYVGRFRPDVAAEDMRRLEAAGLDKLHFAWAGPVERGQPHYYRVQGGNFALEYDNVQNGANHIHSIWRDFDREFGADLLGEHYRAAHSN